MNTFAEAKILFVTPCTLDTLYKIWVQNWMQVIKPPNTCTTFTSTMPLSTNRNEAVQRAIDENFDYLMFIDHDNILPKDAIIQLWKYNLPVVGGLYFERGYPHLPLIYEFSNACKTIRVLHDYPKGLVKCDVLGMGCSLWNVNVFRKFSAPWFSYTYLDYTYGTEDIAVFAKLKALGIPVHVDTNLTIGHTGMYTFTEADWLRCKPGYIQKCLAELASKTETVPTPVPAPPVITEGDIPTERKTVLNVGCGNTDIPPDLFPSTHWKETRLDAEMSPKVDIQANILQMPIADGTFDATFSAHTLEHFDSRDRDLFMAECLRVTKPGGLFICILPNVCHADIVDAMRTGDLDRELYVSPAGPIKVQDVLFGGYYPGPLYRHLWGYSMKTLFAFLSKSLVKVWVNTCRQNELIGIGYKP